MNNARTPTANARSTFRLPTLAALALAAALAACGGSDDSSGGGSKPYVPPVQAEPQPGGLSGRVLSAANGQPVVGATVEVGGATVTTGADGSFAFSGLTQVDRVAVTISAAGFARSVRYTAVSNDIVTTVPAQLLPVATTGTIDAAVGGTVSVAGSTAQVVFPAGAIVTAAGAAPTQPVLVQVTPINVAQDANLATGDYRASDAPTSVESFGALSVVLTDAAGGSYNLANGQSASIRIPASSRAGTLPASVPLAWFNEATGVWTSEGSATLAGTAPNQYYEGSVTHFSTWNATTALDTVQVTGCVRNPNGSRVARARVEVDGVTYSGTTNALTDASGNFSVPMRRNATSAVVARSGARLSNARAATATTSNVSLGDCLVLSDAAISIRLTWGLAPADVDSHLLTPQNYHVDYTDKGSLSAVPYANLDIDDVTSYGPEIVSIRRIATGTYRYFLHNYSETFNPGMTGSPVKVEVTYNGNLSVFVPGAGEGTTNLYWHAFDIVVDSQCAVTFTPVNTWSAAEPTNPNQNGGAVTYCN